MILFKSTFYHQQKKMDQEAEDFSRLQYSMQQNAYLTTFLLILCIQSRILGIPNNKSPKNTNFYIKTQCNHIRECPQRSTLAWIINKSLKSILILTYPPNSKETMFKVNTQRSTEKAQIRAQYINNSKTTIHSVKPLAMSRILTITQGKSCLSLEVEFLRLHSLWAYLVILSSEEVKEVSNHSNNSQSWWAACFNTTVHSPRLWLSSRPNSTLALLSTINTSKVPCQPELSIQTV